MSSLSNKRILLGVSGGIAAYKSAELIRRMRDHNAEVRVVMTAAAQEFITPLTLQALSGNPVHTTLLDTEAEAAMGHIELARWADMIVIAPASADFISKLAVGEGSDLLSTLCLASSSHIFVAPAMNQAMWAAEATQGNVRALAQRNFSIIGPASGDQACGDVGLGRMEEPLAIIDACAAHFETGALAGKKVVITAGPTHEAIDPVRYISNRSSGKMGYALAAAAVEAGACVVLISGPVNISAPERLRLERVVSAQEMYHSAMAHAQDADIFIGAAAVADYRVAQIAPQKLKKQADATMILALVQNPDIIKSIAQLQRKPFVVGFAAETENVLDYARRKLSSKKLDMIIANDVSNTDIGFNSDNNAVTIVTEEEERFLDIQNKSVLAREIVLTITRAHLFNKGIA